MAEFSYKFEGDHEIKTSPLEIGQNLRRMISNEFHPYIKGKMLILPQTGSVLALIPTGKIDKAEQIEIYKKIIDRTQKRNIQAESTLSLL